MGIEQGQAGSAPDAGALSEWADWTDAANLPDLKTVAQRQQHEQKVAALWRSLRASIVAAIGTANSRIPERLRIECGDTSAGGLAVTRWSEYPVAFLDVSLDTDAGMIGCLYTFAPRAGDPYRETHTVWLIRAAEAGLIVTDDKGRPVTSADEIVQHVVGAYLAKL